MAGLLQDSFWFSNVGGFEIGQSLRFRGGQKLQGSVLGVTNRPYTASMWVKFADFTSSNQTVFGREFSTNVSAIEQSVGNLNFREGGNDSSADGVNRDPSAWKHICWTIASGKTSPQTVWINGVEQSLTSGVITQSSSFGWNIGARFNNTAYFNGYIAEVHFIDNQQLNQYSFGQYNDQGVWVPKKYTGTYGGNSFYLDFADPNNIGTDRSGNGNDFTATGFELTDTTIVEYDWMADSPTKNFSLINALQVNPTSGGAYWREPTDGNLESSIVSTATAQRAAYWIPTVQKLPTSGKWFLGMYNTGNNKDSFIRIFGINLVSDPEAPFSVTGLYPDGVAGLMRFGNVYRYYTSSAGTESPFYAIPQTQPGNNIPHGSSVCAYDADTGNVWFGYVFAGPTTTGFTGDVVWMQYDGTVGGDPVAGTNPTFTVTGPQYVRIWTRRDIPSGSGNANIHWYYLNDNNATTAQVVNKPAGYEIFNTETLPAATIQNPSDHFDVITDTGANILTAAQSKFSNGLWWVKDRANSNDHQFVDSLRGNSLAFLCPTVDVSQAAYVAPSGNSVAWCWKADTLDATALAALNASAGDQDYTAAMSNVSAGFFAGLYTTGATSNGVTKTLPHNLGKSPEWVLVTQYAGGVSGSNNYPTVYVSAAEDQNHAGRLYGNNSFSSQDWSYFSTTGVSPSTSTTMTVRSSTSAEVSNAPNRMRTSGDAGDYAIYMWTSVPGYSAFGKYEGNADVDGPFVYTGFRPAWVMVKPSTDSDYWAIFDSTRNPYNLTDLALQADAPDAENSNLFFIDLVSNGFKVRDNGGLNLNGQTMVYAAFAENPFGGSNISPATAR